MKATVFALVLITGSAFGQDVHIVPRRPVKTSTGQTAAPATAAPPAQIGCAERPKDCEAQPLAQQDSFDFLNRLNETDRLFPESYLIPLRYEHLKADHCFGVRLANGRRLAGESSGRNEYGWNFFERREDGTTARQWTYGVIGVLYAEFPFSVAGVAMPAGPYVVHAYRNRLELWGNDESEMKQDLRPGANFLRKVPKEKKMELPLRADLPDALLEEKAYELPHFSVDVVVAGATKGTIFLSFHGQQWKLVPR